MADYSNVNIVAVMDNSGELHLIDYETLANLPTSMANPYSVTIFGQTYDGSNAVVITAPIATSTSSGVVMPVDKTTAMTQDVGVDSLGKLYTIPVTVDSEVIVYSENPVSGNGVYTYVQNTVTEIDTKISDTQTAITTAYTAAIQTVSDQVTVLQTTVDNLDETFGPTADAVAELKSGLETANTNITTNTTNIATNTSNISSLDTRVSTLETSQATQDTNISTLQTDLSTLETTVSGMNTTLTTTNTNVTNLQSQVSSLNTNVTAHTTSISSLNTTVTSQGTRLTALETTVTAINARQFGYFFQNYNAIATWLSNSSNTSNLIIGTCFYLYNTTSVFYVWNGGELQTYTLSASTDFYLTTNNPQGEGNFSMNGTAAGGYSTALGMGNYAAGTYSAAIGYNVQTTNKTQVAIGQYNASANSDSIFEVGIGTSSTDLKTGLQVSTEGKLDVYDDVVIYSSALDSHGGADAPNTTITTTATLASNVEIELDGNTMIRYVTKNSTNTYTFTYNGTYWTSDSFNFFYTTSEDKQAYRDISYLGVSFAYTDSTSGTPTVTFSNGNTITCYIPTITDISVKEFYDFVKAFRLYVDDEGNVCQYES